MNIPEFWKTSFNPHNYPNPTDYRLLADVIILYDPKFCYLIPLTFEFHSIATKRNIHIKRLIREASHDLYVTLGIDIQILSFMSLNSKFE